MSRRKRRRRRSRGKWWLVDGRETCWKENLGELSVSVGEKGREWWEGREIVTEEKRKRERESVCGLLRTKKKGKEHVVDGVYGEGGGKGSGKDGENGDKS